MSCGYNNAEDEIVEEFTPPCNLPEWAFITGIVILSLLLIFLVFCLIREFMKKGGKGKKGKKGKKRS